MRAGDDKVKWRACRRLLQAACLSLSAILLCAVSVQAKVVRKASDVPVSQSVTPQYCMRILSRVDELVRKHFYDEKVASSTWPEAVRKHRRKILASANIAELGENMNLPIRELRASHCQFLTPNDETFYFLHSLFGSSSKGSPRLIDFSGAIFGGVNCRANQCRYVLDGSPASQAGLKVGDILLKVAGRPFTGQLTWEGLSGRLVPLDLLRDGQPLVIKLRPLKRDDYKAYVEAIGKSARIEKTPEGKIGYVHLWSGGEESHEALESALSEKLSDTDGLILDLRDGYGGNFFNDLDYFYRPASAYPTMVMKWRSGKKDTTKIFYDRPVVALINGGVRSGKELVAFSLKRTARAVLVGERTAGAVLAGRLFKIDSRSSLYLGVAGGDVAGVNLEGAGVKPDIEIPSTCSEAGNDSQLEAARKELLGLIKKARAASLPAP